LRLIFSTGLVQRVYQYVLYANIAKIEVFIDYFLHRRIKLRHKCLINFRSLLTVMIENGNRILNSETGISGECEKNI